MFVIESIPVQKREPSNKKYPLGEMGVGQSFLCSENKLVASAASYYGRRYNKKFSVIKEGDMYRCGRVA